MLVSETLASPSHPGSSQQDMIGATAEADDTTKKDENRNVKYFKESFMGTLVEKISKEIDYDSSRKCYHKGNNSREKYGFSF
jgi:hypothetical protein